MILVVYMLYMKCSKVIYSLRQTLKKNLFSILFLFEKVVRIGYMCFFFATLSFMYYVFLYIFVLIIVTYTNN